MEQNKANQTQVHNYTFVFGGYDVDGDAILTVTMERPNYGVLHVDDDVTSVPDCSGSGSAQVRERGGEGVDGEGQAGRLRHGIIQRGGRGEVGKGERRRERGGRIEREGEQEREGEREGDKEREAGERERGGRGRERGGERGVGREGRERERERQRERGGGEKERERIIITFIHTYLERL